MAVDNLVEILMKGDDRWEDKGKEKTREKVREKWSNSPEGLQKLLGEFTDIPSVNTACLVGRDGFLLYSRTIAGIDTEMIGAIASSGFGASESMGRQLAKGSLAMTMLEYENGPVMLSPVGAEAFLVVIAEKEANLGMVRLKIKRHGQALQAAVAAI